jgi:hypothetical protein
MALNRTWVNALVNDDGSNTLGELWDKADVVHIYDDVDAALLTNPALGRYTVVSSTATGTVHNWNPGINGHTIIKWAGASDLIVTGLAGGTAGQIVTLFNNGAAVLYAAQASASSTQKFFNHAASAPTPIATGGGFATYYCDGNYWILLAHEQGAWITAPYSAANFTANVGTWTVDAGDILGLKYRLSGRTLHVNFVINNAATTGSPGYLKIGNGAYGGFVSASYAITATGSFNDGSLVPGYIEADPNATFLVVARLTGAIVNGGSSVQGQIMLEVT